MRTNRLATENAVLKQAGPLNPFNVRQVVRALEDPEYGDLLEWDDLDELNPASVNRALKRLAKEEPYLFKTPEAAAALDDGRYKGKSPGGGAARSVSAKDKEDATLAEMLAAVGIKKDSAQQ
ncbi:hypothetical protein [Paenibacillus naphthalenovorans]|uniref:hypothetical protein n=1 Tax=Paenibacillus naphthalenovorans TaxID=162209 RepID=UPI003D278D16